MSSFDYNQQYQYTNMNILNVEHNNPDQFLQILKKVHSLLTQQSFPQCQHILNSTLFPQPHQNLQLLSLKGYIKTLQKDYNTALQIFNQCLQMNAYHLVTRKRKALVLEKLGEYDQCLRMFNECLLFQPESKSLRNKVRRLMMGSAKSQSVSSEGNTFEDKCENVFQGKNENKFQGKKQKCQKVKSEQSEKPIEQQTKKVKSNSVKFGNFEIIEVAGTQDSDEHFAMIKQQISKILDKKPKKSILKDSMSASIFKQKPKQKQSPQSQKKVQDPEQKTQKLQVQAVHDKKQGKKKSKSVTFKGDTNLSDFN